MRSSLNVRIHHCFGIGDSVLESLVILLSGVWYTLRMFCSLYALFDADEGVVKSTLHAQISYVFHSIQHDNRSSIRRIHRKGSLAFPQNARVGICASPSPKPTRVSRVGGSDQRYHRDRSRTRQVFVSRIVTCASACIVFFVMAILLLVTRR